MSSTPAPPDAQQQNRAPSTVTTDYQQQNESSKRVDGSEIDGGGGGDTAQKEAKGGSNHLSTSNASTYPSNAMGFIKLSNCFKIFYFFRNPPNAIPPSSGGYYQHQIPHPSLYAPRFSPGSLPSSSDYAQGMYGGTPRMPQQVCMIIYWRMILKKGFEISFKIKNRKLYSPPFIVIYFLKGASSV